MTPNDFLAALDASVARFYYDNDYDAFGARQRQIWDAIDAAGVTSTVLVLWRAR